MMYKRALMAAVGCSALLVAACETTQTSTADPQASADAQRISQLQQQLATAQSQNSSLSSQVSSLQSQMSAAQASASASSSADNVAMSAGYPPDAKPGQCFSRVLIPEVTQTSSEQVVDQPAGSEIRVVPATYGFDTQQVLVKEATEKWTVIPATYTTETQRVMVQPEMKQVHVIPAKYETVSEQILVRPSYTTWKPGAGLIGGGSHSTTVNGDKVISTMVQPTGEILCKVEVPPVYKTVMRKKLVSAETTTTDVIPAKYETITKKVVATPPRVEKVSIPAEYTTIKVKKEITPAHQETITIPATYKTVEKVKVVSGGNLEWREVICDTNSTPELISQVQKALADKGYNPGRADGVFGMSTLRAMEAYQRANNLIVGQLTIETMKSLGLQ